MPRHVNYIKEKGNSMHYMYLDDKVKVIPVRASKDAAGTDVAALHDVCIEPGEVKVVPTGIRIAIPAGFELQVRPRSGMSIKYPNYIANSPGTVDADYRGDIGIIVVNNTKSSMYLKAGDRIAQLIYAKVPCEPAWKIVQLIDLPGSIRGDSGYGSTGV
jgi:dUTP pyrophosphatase